MKHNLFKNSLLLCCLLAVLVVAYFIVPPYHQNNLARIMVLACFAIAYNVAYGYCGLLSLGHAMFFAAGMYGFAFAVLAGVPFYAAIAIGTTIGAAMGTIVAWLAVRVPVPINSQAGDFRYNASFMIITLMLAQAVHLSLIYFGNYTRADEGFSLPATVRGIQTGDESMRYFISLGVFACVLGLSVFLKFSKVGRVWLAIKDNPTRATLCGYNVFIYRVAAFTVSAALSALAGACYVWLFGYVGAGYAEVTYSIYPLLWVLVGGVATILGPFIGTALMFYAIDTASDITNAYLIVVGVLLVLLMLWGRSGIVGTLKKRGMAWLM